MKKKKESKFFDLENKINQLAKTLNISYATAKSYFYVLNSEKPRNMRIREIMQKHGVSISVARKIEAKEYNSKKGE